MKLVKTLKDFNCVIKVYLVSGYFGKSEYITTVNYK